MDIAPDVVTVKTLLLGLPSKSLRDLPKSNVWCLYNRAGLVEVRIDGYTVKCIFLQIS